MCYNCPREHGVKRYHYLPHWSKPSDMTEFARLKIRAYEQPVSFSIYDCSACNFTHEHVEFLKLRTPFRMSRGLATHFAQCPINAQVVYIIGDVFLHD